MSPTWRENKSWAIGNYTWHTPKDSRSKKWMCVPVIFEWFGDNSVNFSVSCGLSFRIRGTDCHSWWSYGSLFDRRCSQVIDVALSHRRELVSVRSFGFQLRLLGSRCMSVGGYRENLTRLCVPKPNTSDGMHTRYLDSLPPYIFCRFIVASNGTLSIMGRSRCP